MQPKDFVVRGLRREHSPAAKYWMFWNICDWLEEDLEHAHATWA